MHRLPHRVRDVVGVRGGGVREFGEGSGYLLGDEGGIVLIVRQAEEWRSWGLGGEKVVKERLCYFGGIGGPWQVREHLRWAAKCEPLGRPEGVWSDRGQEV